jgi:hypothetical protein
MLAERVNEETADRIKSAHQKLPKLFFLDLEKNL